MRHNDVVFLISETVEYDDLANAITTESERMVYVNEMSVSMKEFYEAGKKMSAGNVGLRPEKQFEMYSFEYENEEKLKHNDIPFRIIRTAKFGDKIRLICERMIQHGE